MRVNHPRAQSPPTERRHRDGPTEDAGVGNRVKPGLGDAGDVRSVAGARVHPAAVGGGSDGAARARQVGASGAGLGAGVSERSRQAASAGVDERYDHAAAAAGAGFGRAVREPAVAAVQASYGGAGVAVAGALPARPGGGRLRVGPAGSAGGRGTVECVVDRAVEGWLAGRV